jgi:hypothetical protein
MSEYTIINFIPDGRSATEFEWPIESATNCRFVRTRANDSVVLARAGGDKRPELRRDLISETQGNLIYDIPIEVGADDGELLGHLIINYFEDTGSHHETELYKVTAFDCAEKIDEEEVLDDRTGKKTDEYYLDTHGLTTSVRPP